MAAKQALEKIRLFKQKAFLHGKWSLGIKEKTFPVYSPSSGEIIANVSDLDEDDVNGAIKSAHVAFQTYKKSSCKYRSEILRKLGQSMQENEHDLATIMTLECGKPISESVGEVKYAASFLEWYSEEAKRINGDILPNAEANTRKIILKQPVGVCGMITPWNFPLAMITRKVGAAMAAGCTSVIKPSEETPLSALAFCQLVEDLDVPPGVVNVITCSRDNTVMAGTALCTSPLIKKITFTGSTKVGKWLLEKSAPTVKKVSMELGGNAPFIVFNSADAKLAASKAVVSRFRNSGQTCICAERIFVQEGIYDEFMSEFTKAVSKLKIGDPLEKDTTLSTLINQGALEKVLHHIKDAEQHGGKIVLGGKLSDRGGLFFEPTIIGDCNDEMQCVKEETFGPVAPVIKFKTEQEILALANTENSGLAGYFFSTDYQQIWRVAEELEVGMVGVNEVAISNEMIPFGGIKESGLGREGSIYGISDYLELKYVCLGGL
ncbi:succinate-semialdehyde dehydrogenase, mitochondrial-like [Hydractinia symbiolongicarpus]|uniref:succinate-semialdehyde dehydrogenase, mitochondrial-like n=1 Tax=Hydractinia symbiolongicarpus TaxID=13093 RepID=UPI002549EDF1|nr:succinate-semialdehyde dehydrogenase, mitochondrial-like [Hydractinia symbiolongicarpus]